MQRVKPPPEGRFLRFRKLNSLLLMYSRLDCDATILCYNRFMNHDIICPHCHKTFTIDESEYASLLNQISRQEIDREIHEKLAAAERERAQEVKLAEAKVRGELQNSLAAKEAELLKLKAEASQKLAKIQAQASQELSELKTQVANAETERELAVTKAVSTIERERDELKNRLESKDTEQKLLETTLREKYDTELRNKDEKYTSELKYKDDIIAYYKDLKARLSTKMIGESLEQHCEMEFNKLRATGFQHAYFEKDNAVSKTTGSKGDYIYRECDKQGNEIISIMFEMKNENETTATKHKNEDFLKELDKDRQEKNCEYAVLVTLLEADNEYYNTGIVDVSHKFPKMYVIRPQFFIPMITILRNAALSSLQYKAELTTIREQNIDITDFEERIDKWKDSFAINSDRATKNFNKAIKEIEESIKRLENTRDALIQTVKNFETANKKLDDLTIKRLTRGNPTMTAKFKELEAGEKAKE